MAFTFSSNNVDTFALFTQLYAKSPSASKSLSETEREIQYTPGQQKQYGI